MTPEEMVVDPVKREAMELNCTAYWTTLAPNVEEYSTTTAKLIASGSSQLIKGILWCGYVIVDRLKWGQEVLRKRLDPTEKKEIDKKTLKRIKGAKRMTKMTQKVATGVLSGVAKVSGFFTSSVANSKCIMIPDTEKRPAKQLTKDLGAAGHAFGTAWEVFKIRKALNPKSALKPSTLAKYAAKAAASEY